MTASSKSMAAPGRSPCGCSKSSASGTSGHGGCGCGCGGSGGCGDSCSGGDYLRPNFFSGQLLTEDDLQQLVRYIVDKNRLHNRHFFGDGVVCGLEISCDPCGGSTVTVQAGHALDCCGNDIVVSCPVTLDINALYRKLRATVLGQDCGDPCAGQSSAAPSVGNIVDPTKPPKPATKHDVCLYIKYCEQPADPVAPYMTGDNCGATQCEPTRIREGYTFELRCRTDAPKPNDLLSQIANCIGEPAKAEVVGRDSLSMDRIMKPASAAIQQIRTNVPLTFLDTDTTALVTHTANLQTQIQTHAAGKTAWTESDLMTAIDETRATASLVTRYMALQSPFQPNNPNVGAPAANQPVKAAAQAGTDPGAAVDAALVQLKVATGTLRQLVKTTVTTALDQSSANSILDLSEKWALASPGSQAIGASLEAQYFARGVAFSPDLLTASRGSLVNTQTWLLGRVDCAGTSTDCTLNYEIHRVQPAAPPSPNSLEPIAELPRMYHEYSVLSGSLVRYLRECGCRAINPPCPPCDDMGVLLACLEIENCQVTRVCNLERKFVITSVAARYWFPLSEYGDQLEELCCPIPRRHMTLLDTQTPVLSDSSPVMRSIDSLFGGGSLTNFAQMATSSELDSLRLRTALQAFRAKLAPTSAASFSSQSVLNNLRSAPLNVAADTQARLNDAVKQITALRKDVAKLKKSKAPPKAAPKASPKATPKTTPGVQP